MTERREIDGLELLAALSHELRNPLNAILGWATVLTRRGDLPEPVMQGLQAIERNARAQARLISDLLDYVAVGTGQVQLELEIIDPYPAIRAAIEGIAAAARDAGVAVEASFDEESLRILGDGARLQQIVGNLLSNAVKFSKRGQAVRLAGGRRDDSFRLVVSDEGRGIEPEWLPTLFDRFVRQGGKAPHSHGGLGVGLPMARQLTLLHSGAVQAASAGKGLGATFTLELPLCRAANP